MRSPARAKRRLPWRVIWINIAVLLGMYAFAEIALHLVSRDGNVLFGNRLRIPDPAFHHTLRPYYDGYDVWGDERYRVMTNSLGFKDASPRSVPMTANRRRVVFIGDSFTEGVGLAFEETFVGRFARAFPDLDVLNAGVVSYAPSAYYEKLKYFIDHGLKFDEAIVYIDVSDVRDEAVGYCYDEQAVLQMRNLQSCEAGVCPSGLPEPTVWWKESLRQTFYISDFVYQTVKRRWAAAPVPSNASQLPRTEQEAVQPGAVYGPDSDPRANWTYDSKTGCFGSLGIEGGIRKAKERMDALYEILAAHGIALSVGVYPWPQQLLYDSEQSRQVAIWRDWCAGKCRNFFDHFPVFFQYKRDHPGFLRELFIWGDIHYSALGNKVLGNSLIAQYRGSSPASLANKTDARDGRRAD